MGSMGDETVEQWEKKGEDAKGTEERTQGGGGK